MEEKAPARVRRSPPTTPSINAPLKPRLFFLDNLRVALTVLVIFMHTCVAYGGEGLWAYKSKKHPPTLILLLASGLAQTFYMGSFFVLSGHFSTLAIRRKTKRQFIKEKVLRVGVPAVLYTVIGPAIQRAVLNSFEGKSADLDFLIGYLKGIRGIQGPVWYCALLLIFDVVHSNVSIKPTPSEPGPGEAAIKTSVVLCAILSFGLRLFFPANYVWPLLNLRIGYVPQYIFAYILGTQITVTARWNPRPRGVVPVLLVLAIATSFVCALSLYLQAPAPAADWKFPDGFAGGPNPLALLYAVYNEVIGYLIFAALWNWFRRHADTSWGTIGRYAYGAFLVHPVVSVAIEAGLDNWEASAGTKILVVGTLNTIASWGVAHLLLLVPFASRII
jgi:glucans biosynthesis protein C